MEILALENLSFTYPRCERKALDGVTLSVEKGEFIAVCGATGSGKSTLLRMLKRELAPLGEKSGQVRVNGLEQSLLDGRSSACSVGFVMQNPEQQLVTDKVWHELAFGLENMGLPQDAIRRRVAEMSGYFGIEDWFDKNVCELSGGQKQLLNLAAVMVMQPQILILDEPTAQLDPIAASDFISTVRKLNRELALTVLIVEHRLEEIIPVCDRLLVLDSGKKLAFGPPREVAGGLRGLPRLLACMPAAVRLAAELGAENGCPLTVREGRRFIEENYGNSARSLPSADYVPSQKPALEIRQARFRYGRQLPDVLRDLELRVGEGEILAVLGGNGSGKSTMLGAVAGLNRLYGGSISVFGKKLGEYKNQSLYRGCLALLPQDVQTVFLKNSVREELEDAGTEAQALPFDISKLLDKHPYDLSGGEQQLVALAKVLATKPRLLLLDEPTKGLDANSRNAITDILKKLKADGVTVVVVTHDVEFAALAADRCALFFRGEIVSCAPPREFFAENSFYTTAANRMTRGYYDGAVSVEDAVGLCRKNGRKAQC